ncbi:MAG: CHAD domain-containing protein [Methanospirillaceae archaeon]|nr:CHAD domain-containing protein [Methanospirillaceae archaeon]
MKTIDPGYCQYSSFVILPLLSSLDEELNGVRDAFDIEYVHRCRVATRRIRAALPIFSCCIPKSQRKRWEKEIRAITRALGEARDLDVQIAFIKDFIAENTDGIQEFRLFSLPQLPGQNRCEDLREETSVSLSVSSEETWGRGFFRRPAFLSYLWDLRRERRSVSPDIRHTSPLPDGKNIGLECLLLRLRQKREAVQPDVIRAADLFTVSGTIREMQKHLREISAYGTLHEAGVHTPYAFEQAFLHISEKIEEVQLYEPFIRDPGQIQKHHAMRIAAKHLRYTLEAFDGLYDGKLKDTIRSLKHLQDILGEMHDCDVWNELLPQFLLEEEKNHRQFFGNIHVFELVMPGITFLMDQLASRRVTLHTDLIEYWELLQQDGFFSQIRSVISLPLQTSFHHLIDTDPDLPVTIALIGDIHANLPALEAVLADAEKRGAHAIINVGDLVGYGAFPDEVITMVRRRHIISTMGNIDRDVIMRRWEKGKNGKKPSKKFALQWAYQATSEENRRYLGSLPGEVRLNLRDTLIYATHGTPGSLSDSITGETPKIRLREYAQLTGADIIITGHSHEAYATYVEGVWFVNTGSVGRPGDGDPRACYALLTLSPFSLYHFRIPYDIERAVAGIYEKNLPASFARIIEEGKPLDIIMHADEKPV